MTRACALLVLLLVLLSCVAVVRVRAAKGVDISDPTATSAFTCLLNNDIEFVVVRGYRSVGSVDAAVYTSVPNALAAGFSRVDLYFFPDFHGADAATSMRTAVQAWRDHGVKFNTLWLDIEGPDYWSGDCSANYAYMQTLVSTAKSMGVTLGVYTSASQWNPIMCGKSGFESLPLWYAHYDGRLTFSDFEPFGGWSSPAIKQYGDSTWCAARRTPRLITQAARACEQRRRCAA